MADAIATGTAQSTWSSASGRQAAASRVKLRRHQPAKSALTSGSSGLG
jgi:hypothetical protein